MRVLYIRLHNIGPHADTKVDLAHGLTGLFGDIKGAKTTVLNAGRWVWGGAFPDDILKHGEDSGFIEAGTDTGYVRREFSRNDDGVVKAGKKVEFFHNGELLERPAEEIKRLMSPFLSTPDHLAKMSDTKRTEFLADILGVDTAKIDANISEMEESAKTLRIKIKAYGDISTAEVKPVNVAGLAAKKQETLDAWQEEHDVGEAVNANSRERNSKRAKVTSKVADLNKERAAALGRLEEIADLLADCEDWMDTHPEGVISEATPQPDTSKVDAQLIEAAANQVRYDVYLSNIDRAADREADRDTLTLIEASTREARQERKETLASASAGCPVDGLGFNDNGDIVYEDTAASMLSTSQSMQLVSQLHAICPDGIRLELVDKAESLGSSIYNLIAHAEENKLSVLVAKVGEAPATVPSPMGVYVVKDGEVTEVHPTVVPD